MPFPTPNGPTINDLQYQSFGIQAAFNYQPALYDPTVTKESVSLNMEGYSANNFQEDFTGVAESVKLNVNVPGPTAFSANVSDTATSSEFMQTLHNGAWDINIQSTVTASESRTVVEA